MTACDEGPLLEAARCLRRGELAPAEKNLVEASPGNGVVQVERCLLLAWIATAQKQPQKASDWLEQAHRGPYPAAARDRWRRLLEWRAQGSGIADPADLQSPLVRDLARGQQARLEGRLDEALAALQQARGNPVVEPFARYALACLGKDDPAAILAGQPGLFLALRCRARQMLESLPDAPGQPDRAARFPARRRRQQVQRRRGRAFPRGRPVAAARSLPGRPPGLSGCPPGRPSPAPQPVPGLLWRQQCAVSLPPPSGSCCWNGPGCPGLLPSPSCAPCWPAPYCGWPCGRVRLLDRHEPSWSS